MKEYACKVEGSFIFLTNILILVMRNFCQMMTHMIRTQKQLQQVATGHQEIGRMISNSSCNHQLVNNNYFYYSIIV